MNIDRHIRHWAQLLRESGDIGEVDEGTKSQREINRLERMKKAADRESDLRNAGIPSTHPTRAQDEYDDERFYKDDNEQKTRNYRAAQAHNVSEMKKALERSNTKFVFVGGDFGYNFARFVRNMFDGDNYGKVFDVSKAAKLLNLDPECVYVSSTDSDIWDYVYFVVCDRDDGIWYYSEKEEIDFKEAKLKTDGIGTFERLANRIRQVVAKK